jgi:cytochrome c peroxidase
MPQKILQNSFIKLLVIILCIIQLGLYSFRRDSNNAYPQQYQQKLQNFNTSLNQLSNIINQEKTISTLAISTIKNAIGTSRIEMKKIDFWLRYVDPLAYKKINAPLPVEWETEVFEKYEKPYKRIGAGLTLAELYLDEKNIEKDSLLKLVEDAAIACNTFAADSTIKLLQKPAPFFFCNRLFLLNLATIYTTGFECPNTENILPELSAMLESVKQINETFEDDYPNYFLLPSYKKLFDEMIVFVKQQPKNTEHFNHFLFIKKYVNPLFGMNQQMIRTYNVFPKSFNDYTLNANVNSIFDKQLYKGQNRKGIFAAINDEALLKEIKAIGKQLFYDPILSENGQRTCASCHNPNQFFTDTTVITHLQFDRINKLPRNTPSLLNVQFNHLLMLDGKHFYLQNQARDVITSPTEMGTNENELVENVLSCKEYKDAFKKFAKHTPNYPTISIDHIAAAVTMYYADLGMYAAPFDDAINNNKFISLQSIDGFNLFMSKAQCATCHFAPQFNGVKPPYIGSEFEVLGTPIDDKFSSLSNDVGRYAINPAFETMNAFRTGNLRNVTHTKPYMHNGVFTTLEQVIDFYNTGGGVGNGLKVENQTLPSDSLHLSANEKQSLIAFMQTLKEDIPTQIPPTTLPISKIEKYKNRKVGGVY